MQLSSQSPDTAFGARVLFVATSAGYGGIEVHSVNLAAALNRSGTDVVYVCAPEGHVYTLANDASIQTVPLTVRNSGDVIASAQLASIIRRLNIDVVHVHSRRDYVTALLATAFARTMRRKQVRIIFHVHLVRTLGYPTKLVGCVVRKWVDKVLVVSEAVRKVVIQEHGLTDSKVSVVYNGVDLSRFYRPETESYRHQRENIRKQLKLKPDDVVIGMIGRLDAKGQALLIELFTGLIEKEPNLRAVLVGPDGILGDTIRLKKRIQELGIGDRIQFTGIREDIPELLAAMDVFVHLPTDDALPTVLIEAMASALPIVVTNTGGCPELVEDGVTGRVVETGNMEAIRAALSECVDKSTRGQLLAYGRNGRTKAEEQFSLKVQTATLQKIYQSLCEMP